MVGECHIEHMLSVCRVIARSQFAGSDRCEHAGGFEFVSDHRILVFIGDCLPLAVGDEEGVCPGSHALRGVECQFGVAFARYRHLVGEGDDIAVFTFAEEAEADLAEIVALTSVEERNDEGFLGLGVDSGVGPGGAHDQIGSAVGIRAVVGEGHAHPAKSCGQW